MAPDTAAAAPTRSTATITATVLRGARVLTALQRRYEPKLWRGEARAQALALALGRRPGHGGGRDHDDSPPRAFASKTGEHPLWLRVGTGDSAVWGEVFVRHAYAPPWPLPDNLRVLDIGAHAGFFGRWALSHWNVQSLVSVEPDLSNGDVLRRNRDAAEDPAWTLIHAAAGASDGTVRFAGGRGAGSGLSAAGEDEVPMIDVFPSLGDCDFAKIDCEGGEWAIIRDPRFAHNAPPFLVLEYHASPVIADARAEAYRCLRAAGYELSEGHQESPDVGVLWGRRPARRDGQAAAPRER